MPQSPALAIRNRIVKVGVILVSVIVSYGLPAQQIDSLVSRGGQVHLKSDYKLDHTLTIPSGTRLVCDSGASISDNASRHLQMLIQISGSHITIEGCDLSVTAAPVIISFGEQSSDVTINHNHIHSSDRAHGLVLDAPGIHQVRITDNTIEDVGYGILQNLHAADLVDVSISGNTIVNAWGDDIELNNPVTNTCCGVQLKDIRASRITIKHNKLRAPKHPGAGTDAGFCVGIAGAHDIEVSDNDCVAWQEGVHVEDRAYNINISRNSIATDDRDGHGDESAIWIIDGQHMTVMQNTINNTVGDGIHVDYDPQHQASEIEISGNEITSCGRYGIFVAAGSLGPVRSSIHDNTVTGCANPIFLIGSLKTLSIRDNRFDASNGCPLQYANKPMDGDIEIKGNRDPSSGADANSACAAVLKKR